MITRIRANIVILYISAEICTWRKCFYEGGISFSSYGSRGSTHLYMERPMRARKAAAATLNPMHARMKFCCASGRCWSLATSALRARISTGYTVYVYRQYFSTAKFSRMNHSTVADIKMAKEMVEPSTIDKTPANVKRYWRRTERDDTLSFFVNSKTHFTKNKSVVMLIQVLPSPTSPNVAYKVLSANATPFWKYFNS